MDATLRAQQDSRQHRRRDAAVLHGLRDERHHRARAAGRARRAQAGASPRPLRDVRPRQRLEPAVQEVGARRRRRHRQVPPARRLGGLRHHRAHGAGLLAALPAGRRPGQLRLGRRRSRRRPCATPRSAWRASPASCSPTSTRRPSTSSRTTTRPLQEPVVLPARIPEPAGQRLAPASPSAWRPTSRRTTSARSSTRSIALIDNPTLTRRRADAAHPRPGLPDRRLHPRHAARSARPTDRPRRAADARPRRRSRTTSDSGRDADHRHARSPTR